MTFYRDSRKSLIYWVDAEDDSVGPILFSFDKKTVFNFWTDYPEKLTAEQIQIFKKENPVLAALKPTE